MVDTAKHQRRITDVQLRQSIDNVLGERVAFKPCLVGATRADLQILGELSCEGARILHALVRVVEVPLFRFKIGMDDSRSAASHLPNGSLGGYQ